MKQNYLKAVFWDYPELTSQEKIEKVINEAQQKNDRNTFFWIMARFLEYGRVRDTAQFFGIQEIQDNLRFLKLSQRAKRRWKRLIEVYGNSNQVEEYNEIQ